MKKTFLKLITYISLFCCTILAFHMESKAQGQELEPQEVYQTYLDEVSDILAQDDFQFNLNNVYKWDADRASELLFLTNFMNYYEDGGIEKWNSMNITERYNYITLVITPYSIFMENPTILEDEFIEECCEYLLFTPKNSEKVKEESENVFHYIWNYWNINNELINVIEPELTLKNKEIKKDSEEKQKQEEKELEELQKELGIATEKESSTLSSILLVCGGILLGVLITVIVAKKKTNDKDGVR